MSKLSNSNKSFGILGLGLSGTAAVDFMTKRGYKFIVWDDNPEAIKRVRKDLEICKPDDPAWSKIDYLIASAGIPKLQSHKILKKLKKNTKVICDIELFYMHFPDHKYIAVTGTNGKSTTTKLIEHLLTCDGQRAVACGNIGLPILSVKPAKGEIIVLEVSSYQLSLIKTFRPNVAVILNVTSDHLEWHGSMEAYVEAKKKIFCNQTSTDYLILNRDNSLLEELYKSLLPKNKMNLVPISSKKMLFNGMNILENIIYDNVQKTKIRLPKNKNLRGKHNAENIISAYVAVSVLGSFCKRGMFRAVKSYPGLAHRLQFLGVVNSIEFINDSKATNADSTEKALITLKGEGCDIYWIAGGLPKEGGISSIKSSLKGIKYAFLFGKAKEEFARVLDDINVRYNLAETLDAAFDDAIEVITCMKGQKKKILLFSPACASFDQWKNFEERGERFIQLVEKYHQKGLK